MLHFPLCNSCLLTVSRAPTELLSLQPSCPQNVSSQHSPGTSSHQFFSIKKSPGNFSSRGFTISTQETSNRLYLHQSYIFRALNLNPLVYIRLLNYYHSQEIAWGVLYIHSKILWFQEHHNDLWKACDPCLKFEQYPKLLESTIMPSNSRVVLGGTVPNGPQTGFQIKFLNNK